MSVESAAPANARLIYSLLLALGAIAAITGAIVIGVIVYNYMTRPELRDPVPLHSSFQPVQQDWIVHV
ncbi:MAG: hypothetical protein WD533_04740 [Dehalococcoidia bacterium]